MRGGARGLGRRHEAECGHTTALSRGRGRVGTLLLNTVHGGVVEEPSAARPTSVVAKPLDYKSIGQTTGFDDRRHLRLAALRTRQRLRDRYFSWTR
jgi:hypothetical protein